MAGSSFWDFQQNLSTTRRKAAPPVNGPPADGDPQKPLTVSQLTARIDRTLRAGFPSTVQVRGEVSNFRLHAASGHAYFTLKDPGACIDCVMFRSEVANLRFDPTDGLDLIATGRISVFAQRGRYQIQVASLEPLGQGALELARRQIQEKLQAEGLFDAERKKPLPRYPQRIVLVTSTGTAALQDMLKVLRRFPFLEIAIYHVPVQGTGTARKIAAALGDLSRPKFRERAADLILLGRGGGSLEDLWAFNEEVVARAIAASKIPVITGIGHEIDVSIADLAADYHAHTPTEAAQVATAHWRTARDLVDTAGVRLGREMRNRLRDASQRLANIERHEAFRRPLDRVNALRQLLDDRQRAMSVAVGDRLRLFRDRVSLLDGRFRERHPRHLAALHTERLAALARRLNRAAAQSVQSHARRIDLLSARLHCISPQEVLKRGYSLTTSKKTGQIIRDPADVKAGDTLVTRLANGQIQSRVEDARQLKLFD
jgi:exodeoxyribonuclease VII large subunit